MKLCSWKRRKEKRVKKSKERLCELWNTIKINNQCIMRVPEGKEAQSLI